MAILALQKTLHRPIKTNEGAIFGSFSFHASKIAWAKRISRNADVYKRKITDLKSLSLPNDLPLRKLKM
jgi:hypothetical protein